MLNSQTVSDYYYYLQLTPRARCTVGGGGSGGVTYLRTVESNAGVGDCDLAAQKVPEGDERQTHTHTIPSLYDDN